MKIAFVLDDIILGHQPLGVTQIAAMLRERGHEVEYFALGAPEDFDGTIETVRAWGPRVMAYSSSTGVHRHYAEFNRRYREREPDVFSVIGGPHATFFPEFLEQHREHFDALCVGEGEYPMVELVEALDRGEDYADIKNLHVVLPDGTIRKNPTRCFLQDLDGLPFPDHSFSDRFHNRESRATGYIMAGRGCPFQCSFCFNHVSIGLAEGRYVRFRDPDRVIEELRLLKETYGRRFISFQDDTLTLDKKWFVAFAEKYAVSIGLPFMAHIRADRMDEEIADALAKAGCQRACMGLESGSDYLRNRIMGKKITSDQIREAARLVVDRGIELATQNLFGVPGETVETVLSTIRLNIECRTGLMVLNFLQPYPGTKIAEMAREQGLWDGNVDEIQDSSHWSIVLDLEDKETLEAVAKLSYLFVDYPWIFRACEPVLRLMSRTRARAPFRPFLAALAWWDRKTALTPMRGVGARYHSPAALASDGE